MREFRVTKRDGTAIGVEPGFEVLQEEIDAHRPVILRGLLSSEEAAHVRSTCVDWSASESEANPEIRFDTPNYHRIDNEPPRSHVPSILHKYIFFYWNRESDTVAGLFQRCFKLRNRLCGLPEDFALSDLTDGYVSMPIVQHYPRGGGYIAEHLDPIEKQKVIVNVCLSTKGADFTDGGVFFRDGDGNKVPVDPQMSPGDAFLFFPAVSHGVDPIDPGEELDWTKPDGRWMMMSTLVTASSLNGIDDGTAGVPVQE